MKLATINIKSQAFDMNKNIDLGLLQGSIWNNLYIPYKYQATNEFFTCDEAKLKHLIQIYSFASLDLRLYLYTHKNCTKALNELERINKELEKLTHYYESKYSALTGCSSTNPISYMNNPWTWEVKK